MMGYPIVGRRPLFMYTGRRGVWPLSGPAPARLSETVHRYTMVCSIIVEITFYICYIFCEEFKFLMLTA